MLSKETGNLEVGREDTTIQVNLVTITNDRLGGYHLKCQKLETFELLLKIRPGVQ